MSSTIRQLENFLEKTPIKPVGRYKINGIEVFVADGFIKPDTYEGCYIRFGSAPEYDIHPTGCFATIWHVDSRTRGVGGIAYFHQFHDVNDISLAERQQARINSTLAEAEKALRRINLH